MQSQGGSISGFGAGRDSALAVAKMPTPDFIIKYEPVNTPTPTPIGGEEETVCGIEMDAISRVRDLIESGRTTPGRVRIYANLNPIVEVSVSFPPRPPAR